MENITLNPGGIIGGLAFSAFSTVAMYKLNFDRDGIVTLCVPALVSGAFAGNTIWATLFKLPASPPPLPQSPDPPQNRDEGPPPLPPR